MEGFPSLDTSTEQEPAVENEQDDIKGDTDPYKRQEDIQLDMNILNNAVESHPVTDSLQVANDEVPCQNEEEGRRGVKRKRDEDNDSNDCDNYQEMNSESLEQWKALGNNSGV